jgi:hypothetical protein
MLKKSALIIGINEYVHLEEKYQLKGCVNDAKLMKGVLVDQFKFEESEITELHDKAASQKGILAAMERLVERAEKDDVIVVHFSGHGSQRESADLEEGTGQDSTILPHDSGCEDPHPNLGIADKEINEWLGRLSKKTRYITLIFDCCHSGTITRGIFGARTRSVPADTRSLADMGVEQRQPAPSGAGQTRNVGPSGWLTLSDSYVVMSGCRDNELASEYHQKDGDGYVTTGALTHFLTKALRQARPGTTYRDVFEPARQSVISVYPDQNPQIEGSQDREVFGVKEIEPLRFIPVNSVNGSTVILGGGRAHGLARDSRWSAYPQGTKQSKGSTPLGLIEITSVDMLTAEGEILEGKGAIDVGARCVEKEPAASENLLKIYLNDLDEATRAEIMPRVEQSQLLSVAKTQGAADFCAYVLPPREKDSPTDFLPQIGQIVQPSWAIVNNRDGECAMPLNAVSEDKVIDKLIDNLETLARYHNALKLDNAKSDLDIEFNIHRVLENGELEDANSGDFQFDAGDYVAFDIINKGKKDVFVNVLDFGLSGKISLMYPTKRAGELVEAGRKLRFGTGKAKILLDVPDKVLSKHETFKAFISSHEADFRWLQQEGLRSIDSRHSDLRKQFEAAYNGPKSRATVVGHEEIDEDWKAVSRSFKLQKRKI